MCFSYFDFEICLEPEWRALFQHLDFQEWSRSGVFLHAFTILTLTCASRHNSVHFFDISTSENGVFCTFCLQHVLAPQRRALFDISTSKGAVNLGRFVHFVFNMCFVLVSHPTRWLRTRRFSEPTFRSSGNR